MLKSAFNLIFSSQMVIVLSGLSFFTFSFCCKISLRIDSDIAQGMTIVIVDKKIY
jgi:hypothetical protein